MVFCVVISWVNSRKYDNFWQFNTGWLTSLRTWYYIRPFFSFSCSGYGLTVIYKFTNSLLVTVLAQFTTKKENSKKAIYFLSRIPDWINKQSLAGYSQVKILCFLILRGGVWEGGMLAPFCSSLSVYAPETSTLISRKGCLKQQRK